MAGESTFGVTGLAVMGQNLARNLARNGVRVAVHNRTREKTDQFMAEFGHEGAFTGTASIPEFVAALERPRRILLMVKAGKPVDDVIAELTPHLDPGDIIIDGGNSHYEDTRRRTREVEAGGFLYIGCGVSGGEEGALLGPSIMPGGSCAAYEVVEPVLTRIAAQVQGQPCCTYIGADGAGHFVKMVHNGIEYADMQLIAEAYDLLRSAAGMEAPAIAEIFAGWNAGDLDSYLIEITANVLRKRDERTGRPLVDVIRDEAGQKGTGTWTVHAALDLAVPVTAISEAVFARILSSAGDERRAASAILPGPAGAAKAGAEIVDALRDALYASKVIAYAQGFQQMSAAAATYGWDLDLGAISTIWRGGCIIRARFLDRIKEAYDAEHGLQNLLLAPYFRDAVVGAQASWRRIVSLTAESGVPTPAFSSSLAYYDGYRRAQGPANLIQGLRDYFGAHTYRRLDRPGSFHTRWAQDGAEIEA